MNRWWFVRTLAFLLLVPAGAAQIEPCLRETQLFASDGAERDLNGSSIAIGHRAMVVGAPGWSGLGFAGKAYALGRVPGGPWTEQAVLIPSQSSSEDQFGWACDVAGGTIVVGAWGNDHLDPHSPHNNAGAAFVFEDGKAGWTEIAKLTASDAGVGEFFGQSVAIQGPFVVVGAPEDDETATHDGSAYVYERGPTGFAEVAKLTSQEPAVARFGSSVAIDRKRIAVGAEGIGSNGAEAAYVFVQRGTDWVQEARLVPSDWQPDDEFGPAIALHGDTLVVGAPQDDDKCPSTTLCQSGAVYVFEREGDFWVERIKLKPASNLQGANDFFGWSVDIVHSVIVVGAPTFTSTGGRTGWMYYFVKRDSGWIPAGRVQGDDTAVDDTFGYGVSLSPTFEAAAGAPAEDMLGFGAGTFYVFSPLPSCPFKWVADW